MDLGIAPLGYFEDEYSSRDWRSYKGLLAAAVEFSEPGRILDVGAGLGFLVEAALRWGFECEGLEGSLEAVMNANARYPAIRIRQHRLSKPFPYHDQSFQTVFFNQVIEHLEPQVAERTLAETHRVLRSGGMVCIASPSKFNKRERKADPTHLHLYTPNGLESLLQAHGFVRIMSLNAPLPLLGTGRLGIGLMTAAFRLTSWQRLSATASCIAYRS